MGRKKVNKTNELLVTVAKFDTRRPVVRPVFTGVPINDAPVVTYEDYSPSGGTPLNDAVLNFVGQLDEQFKANPNAVHIGLLADESGSMSHLRASVIEGFNTFIQEVKADERGGGEPGVLMVIMTDGYENRSTEDPKGDKVRALVKSKEDLDGWNFFYLGANQDAWATGNDIGFGAHTHSVTFNNTNEGVRDVFVGASMLANSRKRSTRLDYEATADTVGTKNVS